jgi:hypothetical protein
MPVDLSGACEAVIRFYRAIDERDYPTLLSLFAADGVWTRQGVELRGEAQVMDAMMKRSSTLRVAHIISNAYPVALDGGEIDVRAYMLVILHDPKSDRGEPMPLSGIDSVRPTGARLRNENGEWRIVHIGSDPPTFVA